MAHIRVLPALVAVLGGLVSPAHAACTVPDGSEGDVLYNADYAVMQWCDGTGWNGFNRNGSAPLNNDPCTNPAGQSGDLLYNRDDNVLQWCGGGVWHSAGPLAPAESTINTGLAAHWKFDETSGTTANDSSGNSNHGTLTNMDPSTDWVAGKVGGALDLDGTNDVVVVPDHATLDLVAPVTVAFWLNARSLSKSFNTFVSKWGAQHNYSPYANSSRMLCIYSNGGTCSSYQIPLNQWVHIATVMTATNNTDIYINGRYHSSVARGTGATSSANVGIGNAPGYSENIDGIMDDVRLYNRGLSATEVAALVGVCNGPAGSRGDLLYNATYKTPQYCNGERWVAVGKRTDPCAGSPAPGDECLDGTLYAGLTPDGNVPMYTTPCDAGMMSQDGRKCIGTNQTFPFNNGNTSGYVATGATSAVTGEANTLLNVSTDSDSLTAGVQPHLQSQYCYNLVAFGHDDWYQPARNELTVLYNNRVAIGNFKTGQTHRTSTENIAASSWYRDFSNGSESTTAKDYSHYVRCVRK